MYHGKLSPLNLRGEISAEPEYLLLWTEAMLVQVDQFPHKTWADNKVIYTNNR